MTTGTGLLMLGIWAVPACALLRPTIRPEFFWFLLFLALLATLVAIFAK